MLGWVLQHISGSALPAELVELYLQSGGSAAAFEEIAQLPKGTMTGVQQPHTAAPKEAMCPSEPLLPSSAQLLRPALSLVLTSLSEHDAQVSLSTQAM